MNHQFITKLRQHFDSYLTLNEKKIMQWESELNQNLALQLLIAFQNNFLNPRNRKFCPQCNSELKKINDSLQCQKCEYIVFLDEDEVKSLRTEHFYVKGDNFSTLEVFLI